MISFLEVYALPPTYTDESCSNTCPPCQIYGRCALSNRSILTQSWSTHFPSHTNLKLLLRRAFLARKQKLEQTFTLLVDHVFKQQLVYSSHLGRNHAVLNCKTRSKTQLWLDISGNLYLTNAKGIETSVTPSSFEGGSNLTNFCGVCGTFSSQTIKKHLFLDGMAEWYIHTSLWISPSCHFNDLAISPSKFQAITRNPTRHSSI